MVAKSHSCEDKLSWLILTDPGHHFGHASSVTAGWGFGAWLQTNFLATMARIQDGCAVLRINTNFGNTFL